MNSRMNSRDRILNTAAESFLSNGYNNSRMTNIAKQASVSRATLYKQFATKEAVLIALNDKVIHDARTTGLSLLKAKGKTVDRISNWLKDSLLSQWRHHAVRVVTLEETQGVLLNNTRETIYIVDDVKKALEKALRQGIKLKEIRRDVNPSQVAYTLQAILLGLHRNNVSERPMFEIKTEKQIETAIHLILRGLLL